jgi:hypothetical protein
VRERPAHHPGRGQLVDTVVTAATANARRSTYSNASATAPRRSPLLARPAWPTGSRLSVRRT